MTGNDKRRHIQRGYDKDTDANIVGQAVRQRADTSSRQVAYGRLHFNGA